MRRLFSGVILIIAAAALSGCYYQPGYGYVRSTNSAGDAYYGTPAPVYDDSYYGSYYGGYGGYGYVPGVTVGISSAWYGRPYYRRPYYRHDGQFYRDHSYDRRSSSWRGDRSNGQWRGRGNQQDRRHQGQQRGDHNRVHRKGDRDGH